jgi:hypothetical protein
MILDTSGLYTTVDAGTLLNNPFQRTGYHAVNPSPPNRLTIESPLIHDLSDNNIIGNSFQHEIAVLKVTRNESGKIIRTKMIKTMWVEALSQGSIEYAASKDPEVNKFEPEEIIIKTLRTIKI